MAELAREAPADGNPIRRGNSRTTGRAAASQMTTLTSRTPTTAFAAAPTVRPPSPPRRRRRPAVGSPGRPARTDRAEREHREVEGELQRPLSTDDCQGEPRSEQLGGEKLSRRRVVESEHDPELTERQAVSLAAEMNVNRERLRKKTSAKLHQGMWIEPAGASVRARKTMYRTTDAAAMPAIRSGTRTNESRALARLSTLLAPI